MTYKPGYLVNQHTISKTGYPDAYVTSVDFKDCFLDIEIPKYSIPLLDLKDKGFNFTETWGNSGDQFISLTYRNGVSSINIHLPSNNFLQNTEKINLFESHLKKCQSRRL